MILRQLVIAAVLLLTSSIAGAEMYQWVDEHGVVTFKDTPPPASKKRKKVKIYNDSDFAAAPPSQATSEPRGSKSTAGGSSQPVSQKKERFSGTVEIYVTDWCGHCKHAQSYMKSKSIPYVAYDIEKDSSAKQRYKELGGRGVPLLIIGSNKMSGFSPDTLEQYLANSR